MKNLTDRQRETLDFIARYTEENGYPPATRDISSHFGISVRAIQDHLAALQKKGYLSKSDGCSRSFRVLHDQREKAPFSGKIPLLGTIAAGKPLLSEENFDGYVTLSEPFIKKGKSYFALHVRGTSMINAGILDGDLAVIEEASTAENGQIVVAVLDDAITLKRFFKESTRVRLQAENPAFQPIYIQNVRIAGVLAGILRTY